MKRNKSYLTYLLIASSCAIALSLSSCKKQRKEPEAQLIPREVLFGNPQNVHPKLSPDGNMVAYLAPLNEVPNVWIHNLSSGKDSWFTQDRGRGIRDFYWVGDGGQIVVLQDEKRNDNWRLYSIRVSDHFKRDLTPFDSVQVQVIAQDKHFPEDLLIAINKNNPQNYDAYYLSLSDGALKLIAKNPGNIMGWSADAKFQIRAAMSVNQAGGYDLLLRNNESQPFKILISWDSESSQSSGPIGFTKDGSALYLTDSRNANAGRVLKMNLGDGNSEILAEDPQSEVNNILVNPDTYAVQAVAFLKERLHWEILDPAIKSDFETIGKLQRGDFTVQDRDFNDKIWLVVFATDNGPVSYYAYYRDTKQATLLFDSKPDLKDYNLATMEPISFKARDGQELHGYITYPAGGRSRKTPLVVDVHGGPWARDIWGYHAEAQWLANRGYACLQVNYRGSTGYGKKFLNAGDKEWGGKMQDDLMDAIAWVVQQGSADPKKVAIFGQSYGGYAALYAAASTPDKFCCAVEAFGPSNLISFINSVPANWFNFRATIQKRIGDPATDAESLKARSPLFKADKIRIPMLIAQGGQDPRVNPAETEQLVETLRKQGLEIEYLSFPDEGHGFNLQQNQFKFYAAAEKFLAKYLGGRYEEESGEVAQE